MLDDNAATVTAMPIDRNGAWSLRSIQQACFFLTELGVAVQSVLLSNIVKALGYIIAGAAVPPESCEGCFAFAGRKYPVLCATCGEMEAAINPSKIVIHRGKDDEGSNRNFGNVEWRCAFYGILFAPVKVGYDDTIEAAETFLDNLATEADVSRMMQLADARDAEETGN